MIYPATANKNDQAAKRRKSMARTRIAAARLCGAALVMLSLGSETLPATVIHRGDAPGTMCAGPLSGRVISLPRRMSAFGTAQELPALPLRAGEYVLTFDDGPNPATTLKLLSILKSRCVEATFMMVGKKAAANPALVQAILAAGHGAGSHSWDHGNFSRMTPDAVRKDILDGVDAVEKAGWGRPRTRKDRRLFRIPGGPGVPQIPPQDLAKWLQGRGLVITGTDLSPADWRNDPPPVSFKRLFAPNMPDRGVILMHDWPSNTLILLPMVLDELQRRNAKIVALHLRNGNEP